MLRQLDEADQDELREMLEEAGNEAVEELQEWIRAGNAPKGLYDAIMGFTRNPNHSFDSVDWEDVVQTLIPARIVCLRRSNH